MIEIEISNRYPRLFKPEKRTEIICRCLENSAYSIYPGTLSIAFVDNNTLSKIHEDFLGDPNPTDVITFNANPSANSSGEICISVDQAIIQAEHYHTNLSDELTLYLVHGWLHLHGLKDKSESEIEEMRSAEQKALEAIRAIPKVEPYRLQ